MLRSIGWGDPRKRTRGVLGSQPPSTTEHAGSAFVTAVGAARTIMLIRIERLDRRDDWDSLSVIHEPYQQAIDLLTDGELAPAQKALKKAIGAALKSSDLTESDRRRVIEALKGRYADAQQLIGSAAFADAPHRTLGHLMKQAITPTEAVALGRFSEREAFENLR